MKSIRERDKPVIVSLAMNNPSVMAEFEREASAIVVSFGVQDQAILDILSGEAEPSAMLPIQLPASMKSPYDKGKLQCGRTF